MFKTLREISRNLESIQLKEKELQKQTREKLAHLNNVLDELEAEAAVIKRGNGDDTAEHSGADSASSDSNRDT